MTRGCRYRPAEMLPGVLRSRPPLQPLAVMGADPQSNRGRAIGRQGAPRRGKNSMSAAATVTEASDPGARWATRRRGGAPSAYGTSCGSGPGPAPLDGPGSGRPRPRCGRRREGHRGGMVAATSGRSSMMSPRWTMEERPSRGQQGAANRVKRVRLSGQRQAKSHSAPSSERGSIGAGVDPGSRGDRRGGSSEGSSSRTPRTADSRSTRAPGWPAGRDRRPTASV